jgi:hypothetical protein
MEGWFWRFTDVARGQVVLALCGVNRHPDGDWATVAVAVHPGGEVRSAVVDSAHASAVSYRVQAGDVLDADERSLRVHVEDVELDVSMTDAFHWPLRLGGGGLFSAVPFLGQYWHPHVLGGAAAGSVTVAGRRLPLDGANVYAEKNWGAGFPDWWWWGQAQGFADPAVCVAFGGGRLSLGRLGMSATGCVVRLGHEVVRFAPPLSIVRAESPDDVERGVWRVRARRPGWRLELEGDGAGARPAVLPVPLPHERRNVDRDLEHLAGRMRLRVWRRGALVVEDESRLAALEVGSLTRPLRLACSSDASVD